MRKISALSVVSMLSDVADVHLMKLEIIKNLN